MRPIELLIRIDKVRHKQSLHKPPAVMRMKECYARCISLMLLFMLPLLGLIGPLSAQQYRALTLRSDEVSLSFSSGDRYGFSVLSPTTSVSSEVDRTLPWSLQLPDGELSDSQVEYVGGRQVRDDLVELTWRVRQDVGTSTVTVEISNVDGDPLPEWSLRITGPIVRQVDQITFPRFKVPREDSMELIMPVGYGISKTIKVGTEAYLPYPSGSGTMQFLMASSSSGTAFISTRDTEGHFKHFRSVADEQSVSMYVTVPVSEDWRRNDDLRLPWSSVIGYRKSGWESTVIDWYRPFTYQTEWGAKIVTERQIPRWLMENDLWIQKQKEDSYSELLRAMALYGNNISVHWYHWHHYPFDTRYPDYFPPKPLIKEKFRELSHMGAHVVPYINGRLWDPLSEAFRTYHGDKALCVKRDGSFYEEVYRSKVPHNVACPSSEIWQRVQGDVIDSISKRLSTSGVYIDQVACAAPDLCYNPDHNHSLGGGNWWAKGYRDMYQAARARSISDGQILATEECAECYIDLFDLMLIVNTDRRGDNKPIPLFPIVYSDRALYTGYCYIASPINNGSFKFITAKSLLWGSQLGWIQPGRIVAADAQREALFLKRMQQFRAKIRSILVGGQLLCEWSPREAPLIDVPGHGQYPAVLGAKWRSAEGKPYLLLVNWDDQSHKLTLPTGKRITLAPLSARVDEVPCQEK